MKNPMFLDLRTMDKDSYFSFEPERAENLTDVPGHVS